MNRAETTISWNMLFFVLNVAVVLMTLSCSESERGEPTLLQKENESREVRVRKYPNVESIVSIVELLANPDKYDGKRVLVEGFFRNAFEDTGIYLNRESAEYGVSANAVWVNTSDTRIGDEKEAKLRDGMYDGKYVAVEAYYNKSELGHLSAFQGELQHIVRIWELKRGGQGSAER